MTLTDRPLGEQIEVLERGLPSSAPGEIAAALGLPKARIIKALKLVLRKFGRTSRVALGGLSGFSVDGGWHTAGRHLDYAAQSLSLAILERLVHYKRFDALEPHVMYVLDVPDAAIESAPVPPHGWDGDEPVAAAQAIGDSWWDERRSPTLLVPSAVTPGEHNLIINSRHPNRQWKSVISGPVAFAFDARLAELMGAQGV